MSTAASRSQDVVPEPKSAEPFIFGSGGRSMFTHLQPKSPNAIPNVRGQHAEYYINDGNVVLLVENVLFRLHQSTLEKQSAVLKGMGLEGRTLEAPLVLGNVKEVDFTRFLWIMYPAVVGINRATKCEDWTSILEQSHKWQAFGVKQLAAQELNRMEMDPVVKIALWQKCGMGHSDQLVSSYTALCERAKSLSFEEARDLGMATFTKVAQARDEAHKECVCKCCSDDPTDKTPDRKKQLTKIVQDTFQLIAMKAQIA